MSAIGRGTTIQMDSVHATCAHPGGSSSRSGVTAVHSPASCSPGSPSRSSGVSTRSPFKKSRGVLSFLRQKFSSRANPSKDRDGGGVDCRHGYNAETAATLCSSWRLRPRHIDKPIRPAFSDECLSCCTGSRCIRNRLQRPRIVEEFANANDRQPAIATTSSRKSAAITCKHCRSKNDQSPSDFESSERETSQSEEEKVVRDILPLGPEYGHTSAPVLSGAQQVTCEVILNAQRGDNASVGDDSTLTCQHVCSESSHEGGGATACESSLPCVQPTQPFYDQVKDTPKDWSLSRELFKLSKYGWYWGPITRVEAEEKLANQSDGAFLVRDSSDERYLLSLSFRSYGRTLHTRIEHCNGVFSFYAQPESEGYSSIVDLIEHSITDSQSGVFCYSRARMPGSPSFPVRLAKPVSRFAQVRTLQYLCRFVIRQYTRVDHIQQLPLPTSIKGWLEEGQY